VAIGWILTCARTPLSDFVIDANVIGDLEVSASRTLPCRIHDIQRLIADVVIVKLRLPPTLEFHFLPGQYIDLIGPSSDRRSYSLTNSGATEKLPELYIRSIKNGFFSTAVSSTKCNTF
jgi:CDP-4-dehydro-6-deoxyglucose reductase